MGGSKRGEYKYSNRDFNPNRDGQWENAPCPERRVPMPRPDSALAPLGTPNRASASCIFLTSLSLTTPL